MSWSDSILSNTAGVAFRAWTGNVDPWTVQAQKDDAAAAATRIYTEAAAATGAPIDQAALADAQARAASEIDAVLKMDNAHPDQVSGFGLRLPGIGVLDLPKIKKLVDGALIVLAVGSLLYFAVLYHKTLGREFRKLKEGK